MVFLSVWWALTAVVSQSRSEQSSTFLVSNFSLSYFCTAVEYVTEISKSSAEKVDVEEPPAKKSKTAAEVQLKGFARGLCPKEIVKMTLKAFGTTDVFTRYFHMTWFVFVLSIW